MQVLSRHERLGVPLPQRTAVQLPQLLLTAPGGCSSMRLHQSVLEAAADLQLHSIPAAIKVRNIVGSTAAAAAAAATPASSLAGELGTPQSPQSSDSNTQDQCFQQLVREVRSELHQQSVPAGVVHLDEIEELAACGPVGGGKAAYVMAKLLAAAAWKELGLDRQLLRASSSSSAGSSIWNSSGGGRRMKHVLLSSGCFQPGHHTVMQLLGGAEVLRPVAEQQQQQQQQSTDLACSRGKSLAAGTNCGKVVVGWMPDLTHHVYEDLELM
jgi:hypothetical protein